MQEEKSLHYTELAAYTTTYRPNSERLGCYTTTFIHGSHIA